SNNNNVQRQYTGDIPEIIAFNRTLTDEERLSVEAYLHAKYFQSPERAATITAQADTLTLTGGVAFPKLIVHGAGSTVITGTLQDAPETPGELVKEGAGALILGSGNAYSGGTTVSGGALLVSNGMNGSATGTGDVTVGANSMLAGTGTIAGTVT